jgi:hypothetical protein
MRDEGKEQLRGVTTALWAAITFGVNSAGAIDDEEAIPRTRLRVDTVGGANVCLVWGEIHRLQALIIAECR